MKNKNAQSSLSQAVNSDIRSGKPAIQLLVCDIDGTLVDENGHISEANRQAIATLRQKNIGFTLATGRMDRTARLYVKQLAVSLPIISCNGAVIRDCQTERVLSQIAMKRSDVSHVISWLLERGIDFLCYTPDTTFYPLNGKRIHYIIETNKILVQNQIEPVRFQSLSADTLPDDTTGWVKIHAVCPDQETVRQMKQMIVEETDCIGVQSGTTLIDVMADGVSKGMGLKNLARSLRIDLSAIAVIGDHDNDVSMFQTAGLSIAMGDGSSAARSAAHLITSRQDQSGVAEAIERFIL